MHQLSSLRKALFSEKSSAYEGSHDLVQELIGYLSLTPGGHLRESLGGSFRVFVLSLNSRGVGFAWVFHVLGSTLPSTARQHQRL